MPETTFLQIQGRDLSASRVLELPVGPVRIGRGSFCEVPLGNEPGLGDVQCLLRRRGTNWHFQPVGPPGHVWIDGRPADHQRPLPIGSSLRVGNHWLTLRSASNPPDARGSFTAPIAVEPRTVEDPDPIAPPAPQEEPSRSSESEFEVEGEKESPRAASATAEDEDRLRRWQNRLEQRERWLKSRQDERAWEARWKAAGETIRGRGTPPPATPSRPTTARQTPPMPAPPPPPASPAPPVDRRFPARPAERVVEPRAAAPLLRPAEPARRPVPPRVPVRPAAPASPTTPRPRPEPVAPPTRALATTPATVIPKAPAEAAPEIFEPIPPPVVEVEPASAVVEVELPPAEIAVEPPSVALPTEPILEDEADEEPSPAIDAHIVEEMGPPAVEAPPIVEVEAEADPVEAETEVEVPARAEEFVESPTSGPAPSPARELPAVATVAEPADIAFAPRTPPREPGLRNAEWPSARSIFEAHGTRPIPERSSAAGTKRRVEVGPMPTEARPPAEWTLPLWLGWFPTTMAALAVGAAGLGLAWTWTRDAMAMNEAVSLALRPEKSAAPSIDPAKVPHSAWWQTTSGQMAAWAVAIERSADAEDRTEEVRTLGDAARHAAPLAGASRFVVEWPASAEPDAPPAPVAVGRTRDVVSLAWTGRNFRQAGKADAAIHAYRAAFELAGRSGAVASDLPVFDESRQPRRYSFPHEPLLEWVARDMADAGDWSDEQWAGAIPEFAVARLAAARVLLDRDRDESDRLVDRIIAGIEAPAPADFPEAEHRAAGAEALALRSRWTEATDLYRKAIEEAGDDATRRMWWINLAEVAGRSGDESARADALEQATSLGPQDEIAKRAMRSQDLAGLGRTTGRP